MARTCQNVFSTYVEVIPTLIDLDLIPLSILHVCGGDPKLTGYEQGEDGYSPRMWR